MKYNLTSVPSLVFCVAAAMQYSMNPYLKEILRIISIRHRMNKQQMKYACSDGVWDGPLSHAIIK